MGQGALARHADLLGRAPSFRFLFLATLGSGLGTWLAAVALTVDVFDRTNSGVWVSALLIAEFAPAIVIGLALGPLVDRLSRRRLMVASDLGRAVVFCLLPFAGRPEQIVALAFIAGFATSFFRPAVYAGLPNLVADDDLPSANSLLQAVENAAVTLGPLLGGILVAASAPDVAYWINAATFLVSAVFILRIPGRLLQSSVALSRGHWRDLAEGFELVRRSAALLTILVAWNIVMFTNAGINVAEVVLAKVSFDAGDFGFGLLVATGGAGLVAGSLFAGPWIERRGLARAYGGSIGLMALGWGAAAASPNVWIAAACVVVSGLGNGAAIVCNALLVQRGAPDRLRGRAFTVLMSSNFAFLGLGMIVAGQLTDAVGARWVWGGAAAVAAVGALAGLVLARRAEAETAALPPEGPLDASLAATAQPPQASPERAL